MTRQIKFRAFVDGRFIYSDGVTEWIYSTPNGWEYTTENNSGNGWIVGSVTQFTGLKDKNGKEIYEGDVVKWIDSYGVPEVGNDTFEVTAEVKFEHGGFIPVQDFEDDELEIIGNIYEHQDLIK